MLGDDDDDDDVDHTEIYYLIVFHTFTVNISI